MNSTTIPDLSNALESAAEGQVQCEYLRCKRPADVRVRLHLSVKKSDPSTGCDTRTHFMCAVCLAAYLQRRVFVATCRCGKRVRSMSDRVLGVEGLR